MMKGVRLARGLLVLALASRLAHADDKPWAAGVSDQEQAAALAMYREGNTEFEESRYKQALVKYEEAIKHWDHPAIRFNMAVALVNLDQPLEAYESLELAMKFGAAPLGADGFAQAVTYKKLLDGQLTHLRVTCDSDGAEVTLDGKPFLKCKGEAARLLLPGEHQVVASKPGYLTDNSPLVLVPGKEHVHVVKLAPLSTKLERRWPSSRPWILVGAGAGAALLGAVFELQSRSGYEAYDNYIASECPSGCGPNMPTTTGKPLSSGQKDTAHLENIAGVSLMVAGGVTMAAGFVGVYLNIPRPVTEHMPVVTPAPGGATATMTWKF
jgi:hypothetical protein